LPRVAQYLPDLPVYQVQIAGLARQDEPVHRLLERFQMALEQPARDGGRLADDRTDEM
jgi:hypothetical protein